MIELQAGYNQVHKRTLKQQKMLKNVFSLPQHGYNPHIIHPDRQLPATGACVHMLITPSANWYNNYCSFAMWVTLENTEGLRGTYTDKHVHINSATSHTSWFGSFVHRLYAKHLNAPWFPCEGPGKKRWAQKKKKRNLATSPIRHHKAVSNSLFRALSLSHSQTKTYSNT